MSGTQHADLRWLAASFAVLGSLLLVSPVVADQGGAMPSNEELEALGLEGPPVDETPPPAARAPEAVVAATLVLQQGDTPPGLAAPVGTINTPFTNNVGETGFTGNADQNFVWKGLDVVWRNGDATSYTLTGAEATMGIGNGDQFIYSPAIDGNDGVWCQYGLLEVEGRPAPGFPANYNSTFHSRPTMSPDGRAFWVGGINNGAGGTGTVRRVLWTSDTATTTTVTPLLVGGDVVGGLTLTDQGIDFDYDFSDDGSHHIHPLIMDTGSTLNDEVVTVDGIIVARESEPTGQGDNWDSFDYVSINDDGHYLLSGDTDGDINSDEYVAYDGTIVLREGSTVDGLLLGPSCNLRGVALNNLGNGAMVWSHDPGGGVIETLFYVCDVSDLAASSRKMLSTNDELDLDGDGLADALVTDFNTSMHGLVLGDSGNVFVNLDISYDGGASDRQAVIELTVPSCLEGNLVGMVSYQPAVVDPSGTDVQAVETTGGTVVATTTTDVSGAFALTLPPDSYDVYVSRNLFLYSAYNAAVTTGVTVTLPDLTLLGGDVTGDDVINIVDISSIATNFGTTAPAGDVNGDGTVNIVDIAGAAVNFGATSPTPW